MWMKQDPTDDKSALIQVMQAIALKNADTEP